MIGRVSMIMALVVCLAAPAVAEDLPRLDGKQVVMVIAKKNFRDEELDVPRAILFDRGAQIDLASTTTDKVQGMLGMIAKPNRLLKEINADDYDAIVFVGGTGSKEYWKDPAALKLARDAVEKDKVVGAICIAPVILANAGVLVGRSATVFPSESQWITQSGGKYTGGEVEVDGNIITASGPKAARAFGLELVRALATGYKAEH